MHKIIIVFFLIIATINSHGQIRTINVCKDCRNLWHTFDFNSSTDSTNYFFEIDTTQINNLWQLGTPTKTIFNEGLGDWEKRAFLTDTLNPYPINNISSFQFSMTNCQGGNCGGYQGFYINIYTKINSDSTFDGGTIEVSHNGSFWTNLISDTLAFVMGDIYTIEDTIESMEKPGFSGIINSWKQITIFFPPVQQSSYDTITLKFTFTSDSIETNKDGWMIGSIQMGGVYEGIKETYSAKLISVYPNPAVNQLNIIPVGNEILNGEMTIIDANGKMIFINKEFSSNYIDISGLDQGLYILKYSHNNNYTIVRFIKQ